MNLLPKAKDAPRVKLVAIAKDESAYMPEWVFHHFYHGFDAIDVYINRTRDNSVAMIEILKGKFPGLNGHSADWIDQCPDDAQANLQYIVYAKAFHEARVSGEFDYVMFMDMDEFWSPKSLNMTIQDAIAQNPDADSISFEWINEFGQDEVFQPLPEEVTGRINPLVKTLIRIDAQVSKHRFHFPELVNAKSVMVDGDVFKRDEQVNEGLHKDLQYLRPVMVIHRAFRSPLEYISLLNRGRPSDELQIKLNRGGYNECAGREVVFPFNKENYQRYLAELKQFLADPELSAALQVAHQFIKARYHSTLEYLPNVPRMYFVDLFRIFKGCSEDEYRVLTESIKNSPRLKRCQDPDELIELAKAIDKLDRHVAHVIWRQALELRPKGPMIKKRLRDYQETFNAHD